MVPADNPADAQISALKGQNEEKNAEMQRHNEEFKRRIETMEAFVKIL